MRQEAGPLLRAGHYFHADWQMRRADGGRVWCSIYSKAVNPARPEDGIVWILEDVTDSRRMEQDLRERQSILDTTLEYMDQGISIVDADLKLLAMNRRGRELLDFPEQLCRRGVHFSEFMRYNAERGDYGPGDVEEQVRQRVELARRFEPHQFERERPDGTVLEIRGRPIPGGGFVTVYTDITQRSRAERALRESEERFRSLTELSSDWFWEQNAEFRLTRQEGRHWSGDNSAFESELGKTYWELGYEIDGGWEAHRETLEQHEVFRDAVMVRRLSEDEVHYVRLSGEPRFDEEGGFLGYRGVARDITPEKRAEERIQYMATHDSLTDLPNRVLFSQLLNLTIESARRYERRFAVLFVDLDRFKLINDTLGHEAGDILLKEMASRFQQVCRSSDVVARLGGDEFVVLVQEIRDRKQAAATARRLLSAAIRPVDVLGQECRVTASIGICLFPEHAEDEETLMKNADIAMYHAKEEGKNNHQFFSKEIKAQSFDRMALEAALRRALEQDEFFLHYQAKLDFKTGAINGVEALLRWRHPDLGMVSPMHFIPIAEESGLIVPIGKWVLQTACAQNVAWQREGLPPVCMAVNLSPRQFADPDLLNDLDRVLEETGMDPALLELEITEGMVMGNIDQAVRQLKAIKERGVRLAIDDFGTGYSSLSQIKRFPIDTLKVDRSFIRDLVNDSEDRAITQAIISMGKTLSLSVVAEGVETREQQVFLRSNACDQMQGYYFSRPIVPEQFADLLRRHVADPDDTGG
jgi:diguanylate cyclase (GGDEF)-like protein/PAS domain S-box-containing protein